MVFGGRSGQRRQDALAGLVTLKVLVAGHFGVGKTTFVESVSEIRPLLVEEVMTEAGRPFGAPGGAEDVDAATVVMDFGRITLGEKLVLYLFGAPGRERFCLLWDELVEGALGAVVLVDTRRLEDSFSVVDYFERRGVPFVVAVNCFDGAVLHPAEEVRSALGLDAEVPLLLCDARERGPVREVLVSVVEHAMRTGARRQGAPAP